MQSKSSKIGKSIFDRAMALVGLIILSPLLVVISALIKIRMPDGPIFFCQKRVGQYGKPFILVKFRTMKTVPQDVTVTVVNDSRITPLGAFLRKYKIDELPELWNVLKGDMSFVGPRPDVEGYADRLKGEARQILQLKPGITGPATLKYRHEEELLASQKDPVKYNDEVLWPDKVRINMEYLHNMSFMGDIKIILQTLGIMKSPY